MEIRRIEDFGEHGAFDWSFYRKFNGLALPSNFKRFKYLFPLVCKLLGSISILEISTFLWGEVIAFVHLILKPIKPHFFGKFDHIEGELAT